MQTLSHAKPGRLLAAVVLLVTLLTACGEQPTATPTINSTDATAAALLKNAPTPGPAQTMPNSTLPIIKSGKAKLLGQLDGTTPVTFTVALKLNASQAQDLQNFINSQGNPSTPNATPISNSDFVQKYAPTQAQISAVEAYMQTQHIVLVKLADNHLSAIFKAPAALLNSTFNVTLNRYQETRTVNQPAQKSGATPNPSQNVVPSQPLPNGGGFTPGTKPTGKTVTVEFYANDHDISVPSNYLPYIQSITLNNYPQTTGLKVVAAAGNSSFPGYSPEQIKAAYGLNGMAAAGLDGSGQTVGIFASGGYNKDDIAQFAKQFNLPDPQIEVVAVDGADNTPNKDVGEVELDLEVVMSIAPKAKILLYEVPQLTGAGIYDGITQAVSDNRTSIFSISYGGCEQDMSPDGIQAIDQVIQQGVAEGMTFYVASGDSGAYDCGQSDNDYTNLAVDFPASDPNVTAVGGTALLVQNQAYVDEAAWGEPNDPSGGGGGLSTNFKIPTYQQPYQMKSLNSQGMRQLPDVAGNADPYTGYAIYCSDPAGSDLCPGWSVIGGTSASTPMWAGATALVNEYLASKFKDARARLRAPFYLYPVATEYANGKFQAVPFHDVSKGNNLYYKAAAGYDLATGLGSPDFKNIALDLEQLFKTEANYQ